MEGGGTMSSEVRAQSGQDGGNSAVIKLPFGMNGIPAALTNAGVSGLFMILAYQGYSEWRLQTREDKAMYREEMKVLGSKLDANLKATNDLTQAVRDFGADVKHLVRTRPPEKPSP